MGNAADSKAGHIASLTQSMAQKSEQIARLLGHHEEGAGLLSVLQTGFAEQRQQIAILTAANQKSTEQMTTLLAASEECARRLSGLHLVGVSAAGQCNHAGDATK